MFDDKISFFKSFDSAPEEITLISWLNRTMKNNKYARQVRRYRETGKKYIKNGLPTVTVSAVCEGGHKVSDVVTRTGWIALDIDAKDNPHIDDAAYLRDEISKIVYVAFAALSVSGKGVWALVKVANPQKQAEHFKQLQKDFKSLSIILDSTKGGNPNDLRFYSFDPNAYIANNFKIYDRLPKEEPIKTQEIQPVKTRSSCLSNSTKNRVEALISKIRARQVDITRGYGNWRNLGFALESEFGESGRDYYHAISCNYPNYKPRETDQQYTNCKKHVGRGVGIGTFFHVCREHGITLSKQYNS